LPFLFFSLKAAEGGSEVLVRGSSCGAGHQLCPSTAAAAHPKCRRRAAHSDAQGSNTDPSGHETALWSSDRHYWQGGEGPLLSAMHTPSPPAEKQREKPVRAAYKTTPRF